MVMADPTSAIRRDLAIAPKGRLRAREVVQLLGETLPVGPRHGLVAEGRSGEDARDELEVFSSVGFALKRLDAEKVIRIDVDDDTNERLIFRFASPSGSYVPITHVELL
jgi:hypothetical protein